MKCEFNMIGGEQTCESKNDTDANYKSCERRDHNEIAKAPCVVPNSVDLPKSYCICHEYKPATLKMETNTGECKERKDVDVEDEIQQRFQCMEGETLQGNFTIKIQPEKDFDLHITADHLVKDLSVLCPESQIIHYDASTWLLNSVVKFKLNFTKQQEASSTTKNAGDCKYIISIEYANSDNPFNYFDTSNILTNTPPESYYLGQINVDILEKFCPFGEEKVSSSCVPCMVGHMSALWSANEKHATCRKCDIGQYQSETGQPYCNKCIRKTPSNSTPRLYVFQPSFHSITSPIVFFLFFSFLLFSLSISLPTHHSQLVNTKMAMDDHHVKIAQQIQ